MPITNITKTPEQIETEKHSEAQCAIAGDKMRRILFEINFDQENRIRATEGKAAITREQYRSALIDRYKTL